MVIAVSRFKEFSTACIRAEKPIPRPPTSSFKSGICIDSLHMWKASFIKKVNWKGQQPDLTPHIVLIQRLGYEKKMQPKFETAARTPMKRASKPAPT